MVICELSDYRDLYLECKLSDYMENVAMGTGCASGNYEKHFTYKAGVGRRTFQPPVHFKRAKTGHRIPNALYLNLNFNIFVLTACGNLLLYCQSNRQYQENAVSKPQIPIRATYRWELLLKRIFGPPE